RPPIAAPCFSFYAARAQAYRTGASVLGKLCRASPIVIARSATGLPRCARNMSRGSPRMFVYRPRWLPNGSRSTPCLAMTVLLGGKLPQQRVTPRDAEAGDIGADCAESAFTAR